MRGGSSWTVLILNHSRVRANASDFRVRLSCKPQVTRSSHARSGASGGVGPYTVAMPAQIPGADLFTDMRLSIVCFQKRMVQNKSDVLLERVSHTLAMFLDFFTSLQDVTLLPQSQGSLYTTTRNASIPLPGPSATRSGGFRPQRAANYSDTWWRTKRTEEKSHSASL